MRTWIYPVNGVIKKNVKITLLPAWLESLVGNQFSFVAAFGRVWAAPHLTAFIPTQDQLCRFDALIAKSYSCLKQQEKFPLGGIGWWFERWGNVESRIEQDIICHAAHLSTFTHDPETLLNLAKFYIFGVSRHYKGKISMEDFISRVVEHAKVPAETGGM